MFLVGRSVVSHQELPWDNACQVLGFETSREKSFFQSNFSRVTVALFWGNFINLWVFEPCISIFIWGASQWPSSKDVLQPQRLEISDIIFNEILNTANTDMTGSAPKLWLANSASGYASKWFSPYVYPWEDSCPGMTMIFRKSHVWRHLFPKPWNCSLSLTVLNCDQISVGSN